MRLIDIGWIVRSVSQSPSSDMEWFNYIWPPIATFLLGGGGVAWWTAWNQRRKDSQGHKVAASDSERQYFESIVRAQTESIVEPLRLEVSELRKEVDSLRDEKKEWHRKELLYWRYVEDLRRHVSEGSPPPPPAPPEGLL